MCLKEHQPPLTIDEQIENLKEIGLIVNDEEYAKSFLNDVSYYRLIKAYSLNLKAKNGQYNSNVTFEHIVELYLFNSKFRQLIFTQIERVEINLRCRISNYFSNKYGIIGYDNSDNFKNEDYHKEFIEDITEELKRNKKTLFVNNFQNNYEDGKLPFYALIELFSFGTLSKFYKNLKNPDKKAIAQTYNVGYTYLESWIESISSVRNICAHYGRIYNVILAKKPSLYKQYTENGISPFRIFATLLCLKHLLPNDRYWNDFVDNISLLIEKYSNVNLKSMGFPCNWKEILL